MGSQTLEILRQGVWASLTGGWFYDPRGTVSSNAIHLYLFLFLLCTPLVTYIYFTATVATWAFYCISVACLVTVIKIINMALHGMYDKAQATSDLNRTSSITSPCKILQMKDEDVGIEMQVMGNDLSSRVSIENQSDDLSCANSAFSVDYPEQIASTIDFKVDVHRKNSSESNESIGLYNSSVLQSSVVVAHSADVCPTSSYTAEKPVAPSKSFEEVEPKPMAEERDRGEEEEEEETKEAPESNQRSFMQRQASLDSGEGRLDGSDIEREISPVKLQRHRSTDNSKNARKNMSNISLGCIHPNNCYIATHGGQLQNLASYLCLENDYTTKSELAIENISAADLSGKVYLMHHHPSNQMRRDSNSTMSAIQLPSASSSAALSRHPNAGAVKVLPSSVISVRRIKSAAIETSSPHPLAPYISPQPNSVEVIGGQPLRNPHHVVLPPPSKSLSRNPHLNLCPKDAKGTMSEQMVYPIAEQADEVHIRPASAFDSSTSDSEDEDNEESDGKQQVHLRRQDLEDLEEKKESDDGAKGGQERHSTTTESESDIDRIQAQSTDSDTENNGSRSPLLEFHRISIENVEEKTAGMRHRKGNSNKGDLKKSDEAGFSRGNVRFEQSSKENSKSSPFSDWEEASASSKDMLLTTTRDKPKNPIWFDFSMDANNISVDVTTEAEDAAGEFNRSPTADEERSAPAGSVAGARNLGAIPKMGKRIESRRLSAGVDEYPLITHNRSGFRRPTAPLEVCSNGQTPILTFFNSRSDYQMMMYGHQVEYPMPSLSNFRPRNLDTSFHHHPSSSKVRKSRERRQKSFDNSMGRSTGSETNFSGNAGKEISFDSGTICENPVISISNSLSMHDFMDSSSIPHGFDKSLSSRPSVQATILSIRQMEQDMMSSEIGRIYLGVEKIKPMPKFYKFSVNFLGRHTFKVHMDRLQLLALFDRDTGWCQVILATILTFLVSILGSLVLHLGFYDDIFAFIFCFVIAGSQYSLIKSVQPDAASPIHGFNKTVSYSRPIYFCLCTLLLIGSHHMALEVAPSETPQLDLFGVEIHSHEFYAMIEYILSIVLLAFPILFSLGLFPQINTFLMYFLEQVEMHVFGGNAVCNLTAGFFAVLKSILACVILYGPAYGGLIEPQGSQHVMFSIFCALLIPIAYHLSRTASDLTYVWLLIKSSIQLHSDEDEHERSVVEKVKKSSSTQSNSSGGGEAAAESRSPTREDGSTNDNKTDVNSMDTHPPQATVVSSSSTGQPNALTDAEMVDPLPKKMQSTVNARLKHDLLVCCVLAVIYLGLHCSTVFTVLQPDLNPVLHTIAGILGLILHYFVPQMRKHWPWLCMSLPILRQHEFGQFEPRAAAKVMWFEKLVVYLCMLERNVLYPIVFLSALTSDSMRIVTKFGISVGTAIVVICGVKCVRSSFSDPGSQYLILIFSVLFFRLDYMSSSETFLINYFFISILYKKTCDFLLKVQFIVTYIAPWQITWGSAFHAFAQPFSVPHSAMLFLQAGVSALLSTPLNPFLGSAIFLTSYVRPIKFWERDYNTRRIDHSNTRLSSQLERDLGSDDNNLNSIFYEHLTRSLQHSLCGDLLLGRWGNVSQGDCFVLASDYLNCLVHIIELGNGLCTFQMRGLEFRGTYCQQREVEAISEGVEENRDCCCCSPGHLPFVLSINAMFSTRWLAWQVVAAQYILEGYSISDNSAVATLQVFEFRRVLITYYVKSIIYYTIQSSKLDEWLNSQAIQEALQLTTERQYVDLDPVFNHNLDEDYDFRSSGITRNSFCSVYLGWIQYCYKQKRKREAPSTTSSTVQSQNLSDIKSGHKESKERENKNNEEPSHIVTKDSALVSLCLALGILARRTLATASHSSSSGVEFFLHGLHALFKGDFRITSHRDEWVFADMDLLQSVVAPAVRMSLKLHQDHFQNPDDYEDKAALYKAISIHTQDLVISHEADPLWRNAVLRGVPNLLALRHVMEDGSDEYRVIRLAKRYLSFRVIKLNRECVRGLWAGQQQELIYLRNRNPERGSIQNAKQALRNIINSSCDQPIGYPIYVSPLTTSYAETNEQLCSVVGGSVSVKKIKNLIFDVWSRVRQRCREGCSSGSAIDSDMGDIQGVYYNAQVPHSVTTIGGVGGIGSGGGTLAYGSQNLSVSGATTRGSLASMGKPTSSTLLAGILNRDRDLEREAVRSGAKRASSQSRISERERRATLPATSSSSSSTRDVCSKEILMGSTNSCLKHQESLDFSSAASSNSKSANINTWKSNSRKKSLSVESRESRQKYGESSRSVEREVDSIPVNIPLNKKVIIVDAGEIYDCLNLGRRIDVLWPSEEMRQSGGRSSWRDWCPQEGMVGVVRHYWQPNHPDTKFRSNVNRTLLLIQIGEHYVPVGQNGVKEYNMIKGESDSSSINSVLVGGGGDESNSKNA